MDGILNIYKEKGFTSHDVVAVVRRILKQKKVGHTGTLDPDAEGVLPVCVGKGTKLADYIMAEKKGYRAVVTLGVTTTTEDASGEVLEEKKVDFDTEQIQQVVSSFLGKSEQIPPMYSAIKVNGKKLYELAREGKEIERKARNIEIYDIRITKFLPPQQFEMEVICSKGTYIRTLCGDIGKKLGCGGHMASLLRTASGKFTLETAIPLKQLQTLADTQQVQTVLLPLETALSTYSSIVVAEKATKLLHNGGRIYDSFFAEQKGNVSLGKKIVGYDSERKLIGIYEIQKDTEKNRLFMKPLKLLL